MLSSASMPADTAALSRHLVRLERRVLAEQLLRAASIAGACAALLGPALLLLGWGLRWNVPPWAAAGPAVLGALGGAAWALTRRFSRLELALFLDARLDTAEALTTAVSVSGATDAERAVQARALVALSQADPRRARQKLSAWPQLLLVPALLAGFGVSRLEPRRLIAAAPAPGAEPVQRAAVRGLERIEALRAAPSWSAQDRERLNRLAEEAQRLRAQLARGLPRREAQARIGALREGVRAERQHFGDSPERAGLEAALSALSSEQQTARAAKALGDGDLVTFDEEMQRAASLGESESRALARKALEAAQREAQTSGAARLSARLERELRAFDEQVARSEALRELGRALAGQLSRDGAQAFDEFLRQGDPGAGRRLAEALSKALNGLSDAERERLATALRQHVEQGARGGAAPSAEVLQQMLEQLDTPEGRARLAEALKRLAEAQSADAQRERALAEAERGGAEAEGELGGAAPLPVPGPGNGRPSPGAGTSGPGAGGPGASGGPAATSDHAGKTEAFGNNELRARAEARWLPGVPLAARGFGRTDGRAGETAKQVGSGSLASRAATEIGSIDHADVPEEYRDHVGRYFEP